MKSYKILLPILTLLIVLTACGASEDDKAKALKDKQAELAKLKTEQQDLSSRITQLEEEIAILDPSLNEVKVIPVSVETVKVKPFNHFVNVQGQIDADNNIMVMAKNPNLVVTRVLVTEGQKVSKGQSLAYLDNSIVKSSIGEIQSQLDLANTLFDKQKRLWDQGIGTEVQYLQAKTQKEALEKRLQTTNEQLAMSTITAPISGTVDKVNIKVGQMAMGDRGMGAFTLVNLSELKFKAEISETYIPFVKKGDEVTLNFPTINEQMKAKITNVGQTIHPINRTITVEVKLSGKNTNLRANMTGELVVNDYSNEKAVVVPTAYIQKSDEGEYVFVTREEEGQWIAKQIPVVTGKEYKGMTEIKSGLTGNEQIVTVGYQKMTDGQAISF